MALASSRPSVGKVPVSTTTLPANGPDGGDCGGPSGQCTPAALMFDDLDIVWFGKELDDAVGHHRADIRHPHERFTVGADNRIE